MSERIIPPVQIPGKPNEEKHTSNPKGPNLCVWTANGRQYVSIEHYEESKQNPKLGTCERFALTEAEAKLTIKELQSLKSADIQAATRKEEPPLPMAEVIPIDRPKWETDVSLKNRLAARVTNRIKTCDQADEGKVLRAIYARLVGAAYPT